MSARITSLSLALSLSVVNGKASSLEKAGDAIQIALPALALGSTFLVDDPDGRMQFYKSFASNLAVTHTLKYAVGKERPDGSNNKSFPSGHTSASFQAASFVHFRYGFKYAIPGYIAAGVVGYSRVDADKHDYIDVLGGAALGILASWYFTKSRNNVTLTPIVGKDSVSLYYYRRW